MCVLEGNRGNSYSAIKRLCCCDYGIPQVFYFFILFCVRLIALNLCVLQIITAKNLDGSHINSVTTNVAIQIRSTLGAEPWRASVSPHQLTKQMFVYICVCAFWTTAILIPPLHESLVATTEFRTRSFIFPSNLLKLPQYNLFSLPSSSCHY